MILGIIIGVWLAVFVMVAKDTGFVGALWTMTIGIPVHLITVGYAYIRDGIEHIKNKDSK